MKNRYRPYNPQEVEQKLYSLWEKDGYFTPKIDPKKTPFTIIMPPPNANGILHIGHALFVTIQDVLIRYHRMLGEPALWLPGADHAGILTQVVFERELEKKGKTRFDLGREEFYRQCYAFSQSNKEKMYKQLRALGASCDWTREKFTLDPKLVEVALKTFVNLYEDDLVFQQERMINWCPRCATALSDLEVEYQDHQGTLWSIKYPLVKSVNRLDHILVATTRPETMLGDTAVAVNPKDLRYSKLVGKKVLLPLVEEEIEIIADEVVDPEFGTGAVKVTPAHDPVDFEIGVRHNKFLADAIVIDFADKIVNDPKMGIRIPPKYRGLHKLKARKMIINDLHALGLLGSKEGVSYTHRVGHCERCKTVIEPMVSIQWFVRMGESGKEKHKKLKNYGIEAIKNKEVKIIPKRFEKVYFQWVENLRDWCISRQLWWGPRIPVWYCGVNSLTPLQKKLNPDLVGKYKGMKGCGEVRRVSLKKPKNKCSNCGKKVWIQDPDTLDTWFTSGQWPFTTLGFEQGEEGESTEDFKYFYPTSVMETGYEILFFWVARMIMLGKYRAGGYPFKTVYLHGLVRDALGEKMSKSKGNVIDPLDVIRKYGADSLRMALIIGTAPGNDSSVSEEKIRGYRNFANKLFNIGRFILMNMEDKKVPSLAPHRLTAADKKIIKENDLVVKKVNRALELYRLSDAGKSIYEFLWHSFADKYIETAKTQLKDPSKANNTRAVLLQVFVTQLKLLHPFMPFVTEESYQRLKEGLENSEFSGYLIVSSWPTLSSRSKSSE